MDKFDSLYNDTLEEGLLNRASERIKNIGRGIKHPFARAFGDGEENLAAAAHTNKGYRKIKTTLSVINNALVDLQKMGIINKNANVEDIAGDVFLAIEPYLNYGKRDRSKLGQEKYKADLEEELERPKREAQEAIDRSKERMADMFKKAREK